MTDPNSAVTVEEITDERESLLNTSSPKGTDLGGSHNVMAALREEQFRQLLSIRRRHETRLFLLTWEGTNIPRGAKILGYEIVWTQQGTVYATGNKPIGSYDRLVESRGVCGKQQMLVYVEGEAVAAQLQS